MTRLTIWLVIALVVGACGSTPSSSPSSGPSEAASHTPAPSASGEPTSAEPIAALAADLQAAGATVEDLGAFNPEPLGGRGVSLCVAGQQVKVYVFATPQEREAIAGRIDPTDPSNHGTSIVEWAGNPKFWQADRIVVLYLGSDPAVEAGLTSVMGQPFARGLGRDPGPDRHAC